MGTKIKKIAIITGTRADYGLLKSVIKAIKLDPDFELQLIVTGMHLSPEFGLTIQEIEQDQIPIHEKVEMLLSSDTSVGISTSIGLGVMGIATSLDRLTPDLILILGDRFEAMAAAVASTVARVPIAHIHGGETTQGAIDDAFRHAITKMSHLHFPSTEAYRQRVIQLGENPDHVHNVGALGVEAIHQLLLLSKDQLESSLNFKFKKYNLAITFHPVTLEHNTAQTQFQALLDALDAWPKISETQCIFTKANADTNGRIINQMIDTYVQKNSDRTSAFASLGQKNYLSVLAQVDAVVGNSSSGIIEAPSFGIATLNIGDRQQGRLQAASTLNCEPTLLEIGEALETLYSSRFQELVRTSRNPYDGGSSTEKIMKFIKNADSKNLHKKVFFDHV